MTVFALLQHKSQRFLGLHAGFVIDLSCEDRRFPRSALVPRYCEIGCSLGFRGLLRDFDVETLRAEVAYYPPSM